MSELSVETLLEGIRTILGYLGPAMRTDPQTRVAWESMQDALKSLKRDAAAADTLNTMCALGPGKPGDPWGAVIHC